MELDSQDAERSGGLTCGLRRMLTFVEVFWNLQLGRLPIASGIHHLWTTITSSLGYDVRRDDQRMPLRNRLGPHAELEIAQPANCSSAA